MTSSSPPSSSSALNSVQQQSFRGSYASTGGNRYEPRGGTRLRGGDRYAATVMNPQAVNYFSSLLSDLKVPTNDRVLEAMLFVISHSEQATQISSILRSKFEKESISQVSEVDRAGYVSGLICLVSDILYNTSQPVKGCSRYRSLISQWLERIFETLSDYKQGRVRYVVETVLDAWESWGLWEDGRCSSLRKIYKQGPVSVKDDRSFPGASSASAQSGGVTDREQGVYRSSSGAKNLEQRRNNNKNGDEKNIDGYLVDPEVDGSPLDEDIDGSPLDEDIDGEPLDEDIDGSPLDEDIDGEPLSEDDG